MADYNLPTHPHSEPIPVELIYGSPLAAGSITCYFPAQLRSPGNHTESITLDVTRLAHCPVVLGFPWLHKHNPTINWQTGTLSLTSPQCAAQCLFYSSTPPPLPPPDPQPKPAVLDAVQTPLDPALFVALSPEYHDFADVFSEQAANTLPPHKSYDLAIPLLPGKEPP